MDFIKPELPVCLYCIHHKDVFNCARLGRAYKIVAIGRDGRGLNLLNLPVLVLPLLPS